jgi:hypothetical protein
MYLYNSTNFSELSGFTRMISSVPWMFLKSYSQFFIIPS